MSIVVSRDNENSLTNLTQASLKELLYIPSCFSAAIQSGDGFRASIAAAEAEAT